VRELKNTVERSVYRTADPTLPIDEILFDPFSSPFEPLPPAVSDTVVSGDATGPPDRLGVAQGWKFPLQFKTTVAEYEMGLLQEALARAQFNQRVASELLGLSYHQLRGLVRKYAPRRQA